MQLEHGAGFQYFVFSNGAEPLTHSFIKYISRENLYCKNRNKCGQKEMAQAMQCIQMRDVVIYFCQKETSELAIYYRQQR